MSNEKYRKMYLLISFIMLCSASPSVLVFNAFIFDDDDDIYIVISTIIKLIIWFLGEVNLLLHKSLFVTHIDIEVCRNIYSLWGGFEVFLLSMVLGFTVTSPSYVRISFKSMDWKDLFISFDDKWTQHHSMVYFYRSYWLSILLYHYTKT